MQPSTSAIALLAPKRARAFVQDRIHEIDDKIVIERFQDCEPILEDIKKLKSNEMLGTRDDWHVARIPLILLEKWLTESGLTMDDPAFQDVIARKLNDPDYSMLRVREGVV